MCVSTSTIFRWYEASSFGLLSVKGNETLSTCGTHSAQHIYLYEFHSTHFPASLPPPHTSPIPLLFTAHTHLVKLSFRTPHRHVRVVFVAIHLPSITCFWRERRRERTVEFDPFSVIHDPVQILRLLRLFLCICNGSACEW